jgi:type II restriction/modification system DNA methylase subunit YeeA
MQSWPLDRKDLSPEAVWPPTTVIIGNPPFLGNRRMRLDLGDEYVTALRTAYAGRVPNGADFVCYWFERARAEMEAGRAARAGLLATQAIRGGANRQVLQRISDSGGIFWAISDRDWVLDGANVHVSMVGFDGGAETTRILDGHTVSKINADLSAGVDLTQARRLKENLGKAFMATVKVGPFELDEATALQMLNQPTNPNGRPNADVVRPWVNSLDIVRRPRNLWIVDFAIDMPESEAARYEAPFEHVRKHVYPLRVLNRKAPYARRWWLFAEPCPGMRRAIEGLARYCVTPTIAKHRIFAWVNGRTVPDHQLIVIARDDDYAFGVLQSRVHECWALRKGTALEDRPRYTPTSTFETFPFPWPLGEEPAEDSSVRAISLAAKNLVRSRDMWLNPPDASTDQLVKGTLTQLYNEHPSWLQMAHHELDEAVARAYGWPVDLSEDEMLERLMVLNVARAPS